MKTVNRMAQTMTTYVDPHASVFGSKRGMTVGQTISKTFSFDLRSKYNYENLNLVVYTMYEESEVMVIDNAVKVTGNGSTPYNYAE